MAECGDKCELSGRKVEMITQDGCPFCENAKQVLKDQIAQGKVVEKSLTQMKEPEFSEFAKKYGRIAEGTPLFIVNGQKQCDLADDNTPTLECDDGTKEVL